MNADYDIRTLRISVLGAARSGIAAALLAADRGARVFVSEAGGRERFSEQSVLLAGHGVPCEFGGHSDRVYDADILVVSPGIPLESPVIVAAQARGMQVIGELEFGARFCAMPIVAITGTNGKTTTTMITGAIYRAAGREPLVAGNIGTALCDAVRTASPHAGAAILEVSSFQLDLSTRFHPSIAIITTITPDHLDRYHGAFDEYITAKQRVFMNQGETDALIYNLDSLDSVRSILPARSRRFPVSVTSIPAHGGWMEGRRLLVDVGSGREIVASLDELQLRGRHNYMNILMAALAARLDGIPMPVVHAAVCAFEGVEHRLEVVRRIGQVTWINDSKATNVDSLITALQSFTQPVVLIAGGRDKGSPYDPVLELVREKVRAAVLIGEAAERIAAAFDDVTVTVRAASMPDAVSRANELAEQGDIVLLSPACASFDMFENFEHRGIVFKKLVHALPAESQG